MTTPVGLPLEEAATTQVVAGFIALDGVARPEVRSAPVVECFFRITETERNARVLRRPRAEKRVTMLIARPTTPAGILDARYELSGAHLLAGNTDFMVEVDSGRRYPTSVVCLRRVGELQGYSITDDVALSAEPAASTG